MNFNNNMKQVLHILLTLLLLFTFSCNDDNVNNDNNSILIGSWGEQFPADEFFELTFYNDDTGVMTVYYNEGKKKSPDPFTYSFDKNTMKLVIVFDSDPEPPIVYDVKVSEGWLKLDCVSGDFEDLLFCFLFTINIPKITRTMDNTT